MLGNNTFKFYRIGRDGFCENRSDRQSHFCIHPCIRKQTEGEIYGCHHANITWFVLLSLEEFAPENLQLLLYKMDRISGMQLSTSMIARQLREMADRFEYQYIEDEQRSECTPAPSSSQVRIYCII